MHWTEKPCGPEIRPDVHAELELATGRPIPVSDPLADELIATVQALEPEGCTLPILQIYIWARHPDGMSAPAFARHFRAWRAMHAGVRALRAEAGEP